MRKIKKIIQDESPDLVEPFLDEAANSLANKLFHFAMSGLASDLPVIKYAKTGVDLYGAYKLSRLQKKMKVFLQSLIDGQFSIDDYNALEQSEKETMIDILVTELDSQTDSLQSEALGILFVAYVQRKIDRLTFLGIAHELKNTNPLLFYFNVDSISVEEMYKDKNLAISGPIHYLPSAFYSNETDKFQFTSDGPFLTDLGKSFYENVYAPMSLRYVI